MDLHDDLPGCDCVPITLTNANNDPFFPSDLHTIPALPDDPAAPVPFGSGILQSPSRSNHMLIDSDLHIPSLTEVDFTAPTCPAATGQGMLPTGIHVVTPTPVTAPAVPAAHSSPVSGFVGTSALVATFADVSAASVPPATTLLVSDSSRPIPPLASDAQVNLNGAPGWLVQHYKTFVAEAVPMEVAADWLGLLND